MKDSGVDTSGFQNIVLMLIGVLMVMLISNVVTIISNPDNIKIGALVTGEVYGDDGFESTVPKFANMRQDPVYIDVEPARMTVYQYPTRPFVVNARDLQLPGNDFEKFLDWLETRKQTRYAVLLLRPGCAKFQRRLRTTFRERGIDVGFEPWEEGRPVQIAGLIEETVVQESPSEAADAAAAAGGGEDAGGGEAAEGDAGAAEGEEEEGKE